MATLLPLARHSAAVFRRDMSDSPAGACETCAEAPYPMPGKTGASQPQTADEIDAEATNPIGGGSLVLELDRHVAPRGLRGLDYSVTSGDGRAIPAWLQRLSTNRLEGRPPADQAMLDLTVRALLTDGAVLKRDLRIDLATGLVERREPRRRPRAVPLFSEQIRKFAHLSDTSVNAISDALDPGVLTSE